MYIEERIHIYIYIYLKTSAYPSIKYRYTHTTLIYMRYLINIYIYNRINNLENARRVVHIHEPERRLYLRV